MHVQDVNKYRHTSLHSYNKLKLVAKELNSSTLSTFSCDRVHNYTNPNTIQQILGYCNKFGFLNKQRNLLDLFDAAVATTLVCPLLPL